MRVRRPSIRYWIVTAEKPSLQNNSIWHLCSHIRGDGDAGAALRGLQKLKVAMGGLSIMGVRQDFPLFGV
ncbi:hypothetical protein MesoLj113a_19340 [Mesorhizobium sp. 113-1-2]|nr:Uncharacterized protein MLTONO_3192 [Mesorhizobium loti]BCG70776.1 hypothetical protein MesoLj113a_19340 [Mesorhizobium sp. 113-1-2]